MHKYFLFFLFCVSFLHAKELEPIWPTPNTAFFEAKPIEEFIQPTASGKIESGLYGCVRSGGRQFHEGLDIRALKRNRKNLPTDPIYAALPGKVAYINKIAGNSSYGQYIVLVHNTQPQIYTLYGHLRSVDPSIRVGSQVTQGQEIGIMGNTSNSRIPPSRAHLHFEMGLRLTNNFQKWFDKQDVSTPNKHGNWNGYNLQGFDPMGVYELIKNEQFEGFLPYIENLPPAFTLEVSTQAVPDFVKRYPVLVEGAVPGKVTGWQVTYTWDGVPKKWKPLTKALEAPAGSVTLLEYNPDLLKEYSCPKLLILKKDGSYALGKQLKRSLELLFGFQSR